MSQILNISDIAQSIKSGDLASAKRQARILVNSADPHDLEVIANCAHILETWPKIGVVKLRAYWQSAAEHDRAIIEACAPEPGEQRHANPTGDDRAPRWTPQNRYQAPRDLPAKARPGTRRRGRHTVRADQAVVTMYDRERAGVDDQPARTDRPDGYAIDYDRAAVSEASGLPCVFCWLERVTAEVDALRVKRGHGDDGLCENCRAAGHPGIPEMPADHTHADEIRARCAFIAAHTGRATRAILRKEWQRARDDQTRATITAWVAANLHDHEDTGEAGPTAPAVLTNAAESGLPDCSSCGVDRELSDIRRLATDDGLCASCRSLDYAPAVDAEPQPVAA